MRRRTTRSSLQARLRALVAARGGAAPGGSARDDEEYLRLVIEETADGVVLIDFAGIIRELNAAATAMLGWRRDEVVGHPLGEFFAEDLTAAPIALDQLRAGETIRSERRLRCRDGSTVQASISARRINDRLIQGIWRDVTAQRAAETALRESESHFRLLAQNAADLIYRFRLLPHPGFDYVSPAATALCGYTPEEWYADPGLLLNIVHPEDRDRIVQPTDHAGLLALVASGDGTTDPPVRWCRKDGRVIWTERRSRPVADASGQVIAIEGIVRDVSERVWLLEQERAARTEAEAGQRRLQLLADVTALCARPDTAIDALLDEIAHLLGGALADGCTIRLFDGAVKEITRQAVFHPDPAIAATMRTLPIGTAWWRDNPIGQALGEGRAVRFTGMDGGQLRPLLPQEGDPAAVQPRPHSLLVVPLRGRAGLLGGLSLMRDRTPAPLNEHDQALAQEVADRLALALENARLRAIEAALQEDEEHFRSVNALVGQVTVDLAGHFRSVNHAFRDMLGYTDGELVGKTVLALTHPEDRDRTANAIQGVMVGDTPYLHLEKRFRRKNGEPLHALVSAGAVRDNEGKPRYMIALILDITERHHAEAALRVATAEAERANRAKSDFLSRMSHELRTPLNAILGFAQLLHMDRQLLNPEQREGIEHIIGGGKHLLALINEVLDLARIESGRLGLSPEPIGVREVISECLELIRPLARERAITLDDQTTHADRAIILADRQRIRQILLNLLGNAVKYNRDGGRVTLSQEPAAAGRWRLAVRDTGLGIAANHRDQLFLPFERLGAEQGAVEGTGLGLALAQQLATLMGGAVGLGETGPGGSTFWVELPLAPAPIAAAHAALTDDTTGQATATASPVGRIVLLIEDNPANLLLVERALARRPGLSVRVANDGEAGLRLARALQPDLILLDQHLPGLPGEAVLRALRTGAETATIPVVIITADATPRRMERLLGAGAAAYMSKPIDVAILLDTIDLLLQPAG